MSRYGAGVNVVAGPDLDDETLKVQLAGVADRSILHFDNLEPHSFAGFRNDQARSMNAVVQFGRRVRCCQHRGEHI